MQHAFDHLVLCVSNLDQARQFYQKLGFTLTPHAKHPFGTANHLAQLQGSFLEILSVVDPALIAPPQAGRFSFGAFNAAYLRRRQGMSMLVFPTDDARRDQGRFAASGLDTYAPFDFSRKARLPDGSDVTVSFSLAFVTDPSMPDATFFCCQQHTPQYFWKPEFQRHANGATAVQEVMMAAQEPTRFADFFARLLSPQAVHRAGTSLRIALDQGAITILDPGQLHARCPAAGREDIGDSARFVGYGVAVDDLARAESILYQNNIPYRRTNGTVQIAPHDAFGTIIEFSAPQNSQEKEIRP